MRDWELKNLEQVVERLKDLEWKSGDWGVKNDLTECIAKLTSVIQYERRGGRDDKFIG